MHGVGEKTLKVIYVSQAGLTSIKSESKLARKQEELFLFW